MNDLALLLHQLACAGYAVDADGSEEDIWRRIHDIDDEWIQERIRENRPRS